MPIRLILSCAVLARGSQNQFVLVQTACPEGAPACNDVTGISLLVPLFPLAVLLAFVLAWPAAGLLPRRPLVGWPLAVVGAAGYLLFAAGPIVPVVTAFVVGVLGVALVIGRRESGSARGGQT